MLLQPPPLPPLVQFSLSLSLASISHFRLRNIIRWEEKDFVEKIFYMKNYKTENPTTMCEWLAAKFMQTHSRAKEKFPSNSV
jgi:hypothetical protein